MENIKRVQLSEIAELITKGTTPTTLGYEFQDEGVNFLKIECFDEIGNYLPDKAAHISEECNEKLKRSQLKRGDVLFSIAGAIGRVGIVTEEMLPANTNQALAIIRINRDDVYLPYIKLILTSPIVKKQFERKKQGVAQLNLSLKDINELSIPLPDKEKQIEYANLFAKINIIMDQRNKELESLDELIKARFVEMFGEGLKDDGKFEVRFISEIGKVVSGATPKTDVEEYWDGANPWITPAELSDESFILYDSERKITDRGAKSCAVNLLPIGTVLLSSRAPIGKVAIAGTEMYCNQGFKNIIPNDMINSIYLYELLKMETAYLNSLGRGATFKEISKQIVENIRIKVPPIELQEQFAEFAKQVDKSKVVVQKALDEAQLLFDSLMQEYFG